MGQCFTYRTHTRTHMGAIKIELFEDGGERERGREGGRGRERARGGREGGREGGGGGGGGREGGREKCPVY